MKDVEILRAMDIAESLTDERRQYLVGDLALPQKLAYLHDPNVEVGMTEYKKYTVEKPHYHELTTEYMYVIEGKSRYLLCETKEEFEVRKGDFYLIRKGVVYAQKSLPGLKLLFFKYPSGNDKVVVDQEEEALHVWCGSYEAPYIKKPAGA